MRYRIELKDVKETFEFYSKEYLDKFLSLIDLSLHEYWVAYVIKDEEVFKNERVDRMG